MENTLLYFIIISLFSMLQASVTWQVEGVDLLLQKDIVHQIKRGEKLLLLLDEEQFNQQIRTISRSILQPEGYYNAQINIQKTNSAIKVTNQKNAPVLIKQLKFNLPERLNESQNIKSLTKALHALRNQRFTLKNYDMAKKLYLSSFQDLGYLYASAMDSIAKVNTKTNEATIDLNIKLGALYRFGEAQILNLPYSDNLLMRFAEFTEGQPYQTHLVDQFRNNLTRSGLFTEVKVFPVIDTKKHLVNIHVAGKPIKARYWSASFGINQLNDINFGLKNTFARVTPEGDQLTTDVSVALPRSTQQSPPFSISGQYTRPGINPLTDYAGVKASIYKNLKIADNISDRQSLSVMYHRRKHHDSIDLSLNLQKEQQSNTSHNSTLLFPSITSHHTRSYSDLFPYDNTRMRTHTSLGVVSLNNKEFFLRMHAGIRGIIKLANKFSLYQDTSAQRLFSDNYQALPTNLQIYEGGAYTVRGFKNQSLGKESGPMGLAKGSFLFSNELMYHINDTFGVSLFSDGAWMNYARDNKSASFLSYGASANVFLPMGILQISVGKAFHPQSEPAIIQIRLMPGLEILET